MKILFVTNPFRAHLYLQVPLAWALRSAGHEVYVTGPLDTADNIVPTGLPGFSIGEKVSLEEMFANAEPSEEPMRMRPTLADGPMGECDPRGKRTGRSVQDDFGWNDPHVELEDMTAGARDVFFPESAFHDLIGFAQEWQPDLVISDATAMPGPVAAKVVGAAYARILLSVDRMAQLRRKCRTEFDTRGDPMREWLEPILEQYGCEFDESLVLGRWSISPSPSWVWQPDGVHYLPMRNVPFNGPSTIPRWVFEQPARKRVVITRGLSHRDATLGGGASTQELFDTVAELDAEVIATVTPEQLESVHEVPQNVRPVEFVPFTALMPTCSAILHEGGIGSFATALENGVPQVIVPNDFKPEKWWGPLAMANGLESRGAGIYAGNSTTFTADTLRDSLKRVIDDHTYAINAARLRTETNAVPTPNDVVPLLEKLTTEWKAQ